MIIINDYTHGHSQGTTALYIYIQYSRLSEEEDFHELIVICGNFTLKLFTLGIKKIVLSKYFKVDKRMKQDNSLGNGDAVLPSSSGSLTQMLPSPHELMLLMTI